MNLLLLANNLIFGGVTVYLIYLGALTVVTFLAYGIDKFKAKRGSFRIPEKVLLALSLIGGGVGGFIGMQLFRHKTKREHWYFTLINIFAILVHGALFCYLAFFA